MIGNKDIINYYKIARSTFYDWESKAPGIKDFLKALYYVNSYNMTLSDINSIKSLVEPKFQPKGEDREVEHEKYLSKLHDLRNKVQERLNKAKEYEAFLSQRSFNKLEEAMQLYSLSLTDKQFKGLTLILEG